MAAKSQVLTDMQLRSKNSRIKPRRTKRRRKGDADATSEASIKKRIPSRPKLTSGGAKRKIKRKIPAPLAQKIPFTFDIINDVKLIKKFFPRNSPLIKLDRVAVRKHQINKMIINEFIPDVISKSAVEASAVLASQAISEAKSIREQLNQALEQFYEHILIQAVARTISVIAGETLNECVIKAITLPPPSELITEQDKVKESLQIQDDDQISWSLGGEEEDELNKVISILVEGDAKKIRKIQIRSTSGSELSRPSSPAPPPPSPDDDQEEIVIPTQWDLPMLPPIITNNFTNVSKSPHFLLCCNPPAPPQDMVLRTKGHTIPLLPLPLLRSFYRRPRSPEVVTIRSRSNSPSPQSPPPPPLIPTPSLPSPPPIASTSRGRPPGASTSPSSHRLVSSSSESSDPDYSPSVPLKKQKKKRRKFKQWQRNKLTQ